MNYFDGIGFKIKNNENPMNRFNCFARYFSDGDLKNRQDIKHNNKYKIKTDYKII